MTLARWVPGEKCVMSICPKCLADVDGDSPSRPTCGFPRDPVQQDVNVGPHDIQQMPLFSGEYENPADINFRHLDCPKPRPVMRWYYVRLWLVSLSCVLAGLVCRFALLGEDVAYSYPYAVNLQIVWYGAAFVFLFLWCLGMQVKDDRGEVEWGSDRKGTLGCGALLILAILSFISILTSIPK
jgi:hypothetical protein